MHVHLAEVPILVCFMRTCGSIQLMCIHYKYKLCFAHCLPMQDGEPNSTQAGFQYIYYKAYEVMSMK